MHERFLFATFPVRIWDKFWVVQLISSNSVRSLWKLDSLACSLHNKHYFTVCAGLFFSVECLDFWWYTCFRITDVVLKRDKGSLFVSLEIIWNCRQKSQKRCCKMFLDCFLIMLLFVLTCVRYLSSPTESNPERYCKSRMARVRQEEVMTNIEIFYSFVMVVVLFWEWTWACQYWWRNPGYLP